MKDERKPPTEAEMRARLNSFSTDIIKPDMSSYTPEQLAIPEMMLIIENMLSRKEIEEKLQASAIFILEQLHEITYTEDEDPTEEMKVRIIDEIERRFILAIEENEILGGLKGIASQSVQEFLKLIANFKTDMLARFELKEQLCKPIVLQALVLQNESGLTQFSPDAEDRLKDMLLLVLFGIKL